MKSDKTVRDVLQALAFAEEPGLPEHLWLAAVNALADDRHYDGGDLVLARKTAVDFLVRAGDESSPAFRLFHRKLAESLQEAAGAAAEQRFVEVLQQAAPDDLRSADAYLRLNLASHLANINQLEPALGDPTFLLASPPDVLRRAGPSLVTAQGLRNLMTFSLSQPDEPGDASARAARLHLAALLVGNGALRGATATLDRSFDVRWAQASNATPGLLLAKLPNGFRAVATARIGNDDVIIAGNEDGGIRRYRLSDGQPHGAAGLPGYIIRCLASIEDDVVAPFGSQLARLTFRSI